VSSCQKTELDDLAPNYASDNEESKVIYENQLTNSQGVNDSETLTDIVKPKITISVKEVSDGDEESDDDENVSSN